jgi:hypothetical protein
MIVAPMSSPHVLMPQPVVASLARATPLLGAALLLLSVSSSPVRAQGPPAGAPATAEVVAVVQRLFDGMRAGDSTVVRSVFHPQARLVNASRGADGAVRLRVESSVDGFVKAVGTPHAAVWDERFWNEKVEIDGPLASVWVDYAFYAGDTFSHCGIDHFLMVRGDDGGWRILSLADTRRTEGCRR